MISISCDHPDLEDFINIKRDLSKVTSANISVRFTDDFMEDVETNNIHVLHHKYESSLGKKEFTKEVNAREIFNKFVESNWSMAEPGALFWDRIENWNMLANTDSFRYTTTNPCGELPLPAGGSCLLGSLNLSAFVKDKKFDFADFEKSVRIATRALNDVLEEGLELHPLKEQRDSVRRWKQIGLGIFGLADMLIKVEKRYGSDESITLCENIARTMINEAVRESSLIAKEKGSYDDFNADNVLNTLFAEMTLNEDVKQSIKLNGLRNSQLLTCAPTGTLSTMFGISGGIEPIYNYGYWRTTKSLHGTDVKYKIYTPIVKKYIEKNNLKDDSELPSFFTNALLLNYEERINMQSVWQRYIDGAISSTLNIPKETTKEEVFKIYMKAWKAGLKGITIFRDGCDRIPILDSSNSKELKRGDLLNKDNLIGVKRTLVVGCGRLHCSAFFDSETGEFVELFLGKGSQGGCLSTLNGLARLVSLSARAGAKLEDIIGQLKSANACPSYAVRSATKKDTSKGSCCPSAIANALMEMSKQIKEMKNIKVDDKIKPISVETSSKNLCPICSSKLEHTNGCIECKNCGWSKCNL